MNKIHHCMIDGVSGVDLMSVLMTAEPTEEIEPPPLWLPRRAPSAAQYAASEAASRLRAPLDALRAVGRLVTDEDHARASLVERLGAAGRVLASGVSAVPATPLNQPIGPHRRFDWLAMRFEDIQFVRRRLGGTVNDVVLAVVAGAVRRFFKHVRLTDPDGIEFRVMAPVSMREARERGALGNRVSAWFVPLPIGERDPLVRYARVLETTADLKRRHEALGAETITQVVEWLGSAPIALGARLLERSQPPFHMVVTNVPGPRIALYLLGARMLEALSARAADGPALARHRALQLRRDPVVGLRGGLGAGARSARVRARRAARLRPVARARAGGARAARGCDRGRRARSARETDPQGDAPPRPIRVAWRPWTPPERPASTATRRPRASRTGSPR